MIFHILNRLRLYMSKVANKFHYGYNDCNGTRIEWFTNLGPKFYQKNYLTLKTGKFRVSRKDNENGHRYFINDMRDESIEANSVILFNEEDLNLVEEYKIAPAYTRDDVKVYYFGEYIHVSSSDVLVISPTGIHVRHTLT